MLLSPVIGSSLSTFFKRSLPAKSTKFSLEWMTLSLEARRDRVIYTVKIQWLRLDVVLRTCCAVVRFSAPSNRQFRASFSLLLLSTKPRTCVPFPWRLSSTMLYADWSVGQRSANQICVRCKAPYTTQKLWTRTPSGFQFHGKYEQGRGWIPLWWYVPRTKHCERFSSTSLPVGHDCTITTINTLQLLWTCSTRSTCLGQRYEEHCDTRTGMSPSYWHYCDYHHHRPDAQTYEHKWNFILVDFKLTSEVRRWADPNTNFYVWQCSSLLRVLPEMQWVSQDKYKRTKQTS